MDAPATYLAFAGPRRIGAGPLEEILPVLKQRFDAGAGEPVLVFDAETGEQVDFDLRGTLAEVLERAASPVRGPGRPRLGVVGREISLLPRHWDWLEQQPNGKSAALRRLIDEARKHAPSEQHARRARAAANRVATALAGNLEHFEEAMRALYRKDEKRWKRMSRSWPRDVRHYLGDLLAGTWQARPDRS